MLQSLLDRVVAKASERGIELPSRVPAKAWTNRNGGAHASTRESAHEIAAPQMQEPTTTVLTVPMPMPPPTLEDVHGAAAYAAAAEAGESLQPPLLSPANEPRPALLAFPDESAVAPPLVVMDEPMPVSGIGHGPAGWGSQDSPLVTATRLAAESSQVGYEPPPPPEAVTAPAYVERPTALVQFDGAFDDETTASGNPIEIEAIVLEEARLAQEEMERELAASGLLADDDDDDDPATMGAVMSPYAELTRPASELPPTSVIDVSAVLASEHARPRSRTSEPPPVPGAETHAPGQDDEISSVRPVESAPRAASLRPSAYPLELEDLDELAGASAGELPLEEAADGDRATLPPPPARVETPHLMLDQITDDGAAPWNAEPSRAGLEAGHTETGFVAPPPAPPSRPSRQPPGEASDEVLLDEHDVLLLEPADADDGEREEEAAPLSLRAPLEEPTDATDEASRPPSTEPPPTEQARASVEHVEATALVAFADSAERAALVEAARLDDPPELLDEDIADEPSGPVPIEAAGLDEAPISSRQALDPARAIDDRLEGIAEPPPESGEVESQRYPVGAASTRAPREGDDGKPLEQASAAGGLGVELPVVVDRPTSEVEPLVAAFEGHRASVDLNFGELLDAALSLG